MYLILQICRTSLRWQGPESCPSLWHMSILLRHLRHQGLPPCQTLPVFCYQDRAQAVGRVMPSGMGRGSRAVRGARKPASPETDNTILSWSVARKLLLVFSVCQSTLRFPGQQLNTECWAELIHSAKETTSRIAAANGVPPY